MVSVVMIRARLLFLTQRAVEILYDGIDGFAGPIFWLQAGRPTTVDAVNKMSTQVRA